MSFSAVSVPDRMGSVVETGWGWNVYGNSLPEKNRTGLVFPSWVRGILLLVEGKGSLSVVFVLKQRKIFSSFKAFSVFKHLKQIFLGHLCGILSIHFKSVI